MSSTAAPTPEQKRAQAKAQARGAAIAGGMNVLAEGLTGYEEEGIVKAFGHPWSAAELDTQSTLRALVFVLKKREGLDHKAAKDAVMQMTAKAVQDVVVSYDEGEVDPDESESGKDEDEPRSTPPGA